MDDNTFAYIFEGIECDLDGAYIWCVIEDGHYDVRSQKTRICVGNPNSPPQILDIPSQVVVEQSEEAEIRCVANAPGNTQLSFLWYKTDTGRMEDIRAVNRGTETADFSTVAWLTKQKGLLQNESFAAAPLYYIFSKPTSKPPCSA